MGMAILLIVYGALIVLGGLAAFARAKSRVSLVVGGFAGIVLIVCGALNWMGSNAAAYAGIAMTVILTLLFGLRYRRTKQVRPAGVMMVLSLIVAVALGYMLFA